MITRTEHADYPQRCPFEYSHHVEECGKCRDMAVECLRLEEGATVVAQSRHVSVDPDGTERAYITNILETYVGRVVAMFVKYGVQVMSDVWEDQQWATVVSRHGAFVDVYAGYVEGADTVDAPPEMIAAWETEKLRRKTEAEERERQRIIARAEAEAKIPRKGRTVRVVRGRKVPIGTVGMCFWVGNSGYGESVGFTTAAGAKHFTAAKNVEAVPA
jgi:hypothetical protein